MQPALSARECQPQCQGNGSDQSFFTNSKTLVGGCRDRPRRALPLTCPNVKTTLNFKKEQKSKHRKNQKIFKSTNLLQKKKKNVEVILVCFCAVSHPQPSHRSGHGCTVGVHGDPPQPSLSGLWVCCECQLGSTQAGWWSHQSASSCLGCRSAVVVVSEVVDELSESLYSATHTVDREHVSWASGDMNSPTRDLASVLGLCTLHGFLHL